MEDQMAIYCPMCGQETTKIVEESAGAEPALQDFAMPGKTRKSRNILKVIGVAIIVFVVLSSIITAHWPSRSHPIVGTWEFMADESPTIDTYWLVGSWIDIYHPDGTGISRWGGDTGAFTWTIDDDQITFVYIYDGIPEETVYDFSMMGTRMILSVPDEPWFRWIFRRVE